MRKFIVALICIVFVLSLCGCGAKPIVLSTGEYPQETISITAPVVPEDLPLLDGFPQLQSADFSGSSCYEEIVSWAAAHPQVNVSYTVALPDGKAVPHNVKSLDLSDMDSKQLDDCVPLLAYLPSVNSVSLPKQLESSQLQAFAEAVPEAELDYSLSVAGVTLSPDTTKLDLSSMDSAKFHTLLPWLSITKQIKEIELGTDGDGSVLSWDDISSLHAALPDAKLNYSFKLYDKDFSLSDTEMILRHIPIDDEGELVKKVSSCMPDLSYLDMDSCGVSNEAMAEIRDSLPNTDVVWRIWFGTGYSVRTDVERILASNPGRGGELTGENTACLKYCTKVKYLDLGHNNYLDDIGFTAYMPDLEVLIVAMGNWSDCSPLVNCPKIEYLEVQSSSLNDLRPLTELKNLKHL
ncbi:MAG: hypothetical protein IJ364_03920, partial [Oscillospiraceae bacterium]|nr:hypothetical protein [Oscillospiraceae bacterium]